MYILFKGFSGGSAGRESACNAGDLGWEDPLEKGTATHSSILAGDLHGLCSPWGCKELHTTEQLSVSLDLHFSSYLKPLGRSTCTDLKGCPGWLNLKEKKKQFTIIYIYIYIFFFFFFLSCKRKCTGKCNLECFPAANNGWDRTMGTSPLYIKDNSVMFGCLWQDMLPLGEGNGNPLQYSCLENPRDGGTWWSAVYGVAQSWT